MKTLAELKKDMDEAVEAFRKAQWEVEKAEKAFWEANEKHNQAIKDGVK